MAPHDLDRPVHHLLDLQLLRDRRQPRVSWQRRAGPAPPRGVFRGRHRRRRRGRHPAPRRLRAGRRLPGQAAAGAAAAAAAPRVDGDAAAVPEYQDSGHEDVANNNYDTSYSNYDGGGGYNNYDGGYDIADSNNNHSTAPIGRAPTGEGMDDLHEISPVTTTAEVYYDPPTAHEFVGAPDGYYYEFPTGHGYVGRRAAVSGRRQPVRTVRRVESAGPPGADRPRGRAPASGGHTPLPSWGGEGALIHVDEITQRGQFLHSGGGILAWGDCIFVYIWDLDTYYSTSLREHGRSHASAL